MKGIMRKISTRPWIWVMTVVFVVVFVGGGYAYYPKEELVHSLQQKREVYVSGTGTFKAEPDVAFLQVGIVTEHEQANASQAKNAEIQKMVVSALEKLGVEKKDISTVHYGIQPQYRYTDNRQPELVGYQTVQHLNIVVKDVEMLGSLLDVSVKAGANRVNSIHFGLLDTSDLQMKALEEAVKDARKKAQVALNADGEEVLHMTQLSITGTMDGTPPPMKRDMLGASEQGVPSLMPGETTVTVSVQAVFSF